MSRFSESKFAHVPIAILEEYGLPLRDINALENANCVYVGQLPDDLDSLLVMIQFASKGLESLKQSLENLETETGVPRFVMMKNKIDTRTALLREKKIKDKREGGLD